MRDQVTYDVNFNVKKKKLTKWFLFVLIFNIGLQLDFVESILDFQSSDHQIIAKNSDICGSGLNINKPTSNDESIQQLMAVSGFSTNSFQLSFFILSRYEGSKRNCSQSQFKINENKCLLELIAAEFSGLSPPQA